ncbi:MAG: hypothetical protein SGPRY_011208 [Prymnesium sp.]
MRECGFYSFSHSVGCHQVDSSGMLQGVAEGRALHDAGLRAGDKLHACIGERTRPERRASLASTCGLISRQGLTQPHINEAMESSPSGVEVGVECVEIVSAFTTELGEGKEEGEGECAVERERIWTPLLCKTSVGTWEPCNLDDTVYVMTGKGEGRERVRIWGVDESGRRGGCELEGWRQ